MKNLIIAASALMLVACSKSENKKEDQMSGLATVVSSAKNRNTFRTSADDVSKNIEALKILTPLTNEELKAVLPEQLSGLKRTELSVGDNPMMQISTAEAKYKNEDGSKRITLEIMDGAGETGSAMVSILLMGLNMNKEKITESGFERSEEINGMKSMVSEKKSGGSVNSEIQMVAKNRYAVTLRGDGITSEELKTAMDELNVSNLK